MTCPKCGSNNIQVVQGDSKIKNNGCLWTLGRWFMILITAGLWLMVGKREGKLKTQTLAVCVNCGHKWRI